MDESPIPEATRLTASVSNGVTFSLVVPVYRNVESIPALVERVSSIDFELGQDFEAVFVDDGSPDRSYDVLVEALARSTFRSRVIRHSRNFGAFAAIRTGLDRSSGRWIAVMAADLQEPQSLVIDFFRTLATGVADVAVGTRRGRNDPWSSKVLSSIYWGAYRMLVQRGVPKGGVDIFACSREVAHELIALKESNTSLVGQLFWVGYRRVEVPYVREARLHGHSAWSVRKKLKYLTDSVFSFTSLPITLILVIGLIGTLTSLLAALAVFIAWAAGSIEVEGYTAEMLVQLLTSASLLFAVGVVGTYVWRTYENSKMRPTSIIMSTEDFSAP